MNENNNKKFGKKCPYCGSKLKRKIDYCENCGRTIGKKSEGGSEDFYINNRHLRNALAFFSIFSSPFIIMFIVYSILSFSFDILLLLLPIFSCLFLILFVKFSHRKVDLYISHDKFKVLISNSLYFQINWEDVKEITIIETIYEHKTAATRYTRSKIVNLTGYKLEFISSTEKKSLKLWGFRFTKKQEIKIIDKLEHFSVVKGKKLNTIKSSGEIFSLSNAKNNYQCDY